MIRVVQIVSRFAPAMGGTERQAELLGNALLAQGIAIEILTHRYRADLARIEEREGLVIRRLGPPGNTTAASAGFIASGLVHLAATRPRPAILHAHMIASPAMLAIAAARLTGAKTVVKVACSGPFGDVATSRQTRLGQAKLRFVLTHTDRLVCLSAESEKEIHSAGAPASRVIRIQNGVDTAVFKPVEDTAERTNLRRELGLPPGRLILYSGRLTAQKRVSDLLEAFADVVSRLSDLHLVLVGEGEESAALKRRAGELGLGKRVLMAGCQTRMDCWYRACDLFVLPSVAEGLSNSLLEAMSSGLLCVAGRIGGTTGVLVHEDNGLLFTPGSAAELAPVLERALAPGFDAARLGLAARATIVTGFGIESVAARYRALYESLLK